MILEHSYGDIFSRPGIDPKTRELTACAALAAAFFAQTRVGTALDRIDQAMPRWDTIESGLAGTAAPWLIIAGLAVIGVAVLIV